MSGTGPRRNERERERDLGIISELYVRKVPTVEIARIVSEQYEGFELTDRTIRNDLQEIKKRWIESQLVPFDEAKAKELAEIDELERQYYVGWFRSLEDLDEHEQEHTKSEQPVGGAEVKTLASERKKQKTGKRSGDKNFLDGVWKCIETRAKILGLFSAEKFEFQWREELKKQGFSDKEIEETIEMAADVVERTWRKAEQED